MPLCPGRKGFPTGITFQRSCNVPCKSLLAIELEVISRSSNGISGSMALRLIFACSVSPRASVCVPGPSCEPAPITRCCTSCGALTSTVFPQLRLRTLRPSFRFFSLMGLQVSTCYLLTDFPPQCDQKQACFQVFNVCEAFCCS